METSNIYETFDKFKIHLKDITIYSKAIDAYNNFSSEASDNKEYKLIESMLNENNYRKKIDDKQFYNLIISANNTEHKEDLDIIVNEIKENTDDLIQLDTITRLVNTRSLKYNNIKFQKRFIAKKCPHCDMSTDCSSDTYYIICGCGKQGFDWKGCGYDWCFNCEKKLCKSWTQNHLFNTVNRHHDDKCCKKHALETDGDYFSDYCQCNTDNVKR
jgi:hypothetical protein